MFRCRRCGESIDENQYNIYNQCCPHCNRILISKRQGSITKKQITEKPKPNVLLIAGLIGFLLIVPVLIYYFFPYSYVGVQEDDEYSWIYDFSNSTFDKYNNDTGGGAESLFFSKAEGVLDVKIKPARN